MYLTEYSIKKNKPNDLLVDLKIVLALHLSDQNRGWSERGACLGMGGNSNRGAYQNLKSYWGR